MGNDGLDPHTLARYIDHTYLKPDARRSTIEGLCEEARKYNFYSVCVNSVWAALCKELLQGSGTKVCVVTGFSLGAGLSSAKAFEAAEAVERGASEIDMVISVGHLLDGDHSFVQADIAEVVKAVEGQAIVKVILETGLLNDEQKRIGCRLSEAAGAHFVKTSTGFNYGGATVEDIRLMRASVSDSVGVKASGGVRDLDTALRMIEAGATRLGTSSGVALVTTGSAGSSSY